MTTKINPVTPKGDRDRILKELEEVWPDFDHEIIGLLDGGGNGWVVRVMMSHGKRGVLKYYAKSLERRGDMPLTLEQRRQLITLEAETMAEFEDHPASTRIHVLAPSKLAFLMEYHPKGSLEENLIRLDWSKEEKIRRFLPVVRLLAEMQRAGYHHRDITLDNILLDSEERLHLIDFGFVHHESNVIAEGWALKDEVYRHPRSDEMTENRAGTERFRHDIRDVFATVVVLRSLLTSQNPRSGATSAQTGDPRIDALLESYLDPKGPLPPFAEGIGSFSHLIQQLESLQAEPAEVAKKAKQWNRKWLAAALLTICLVPLGWLGKNELFQLLGPQTVSQPLVPEPTQPENNKSLDDPSTEFQGIPSDNPPGDEPRIALDPVYVESSPEKVSDTIEPSRPNARLDSGEPGGPSEEQPQTVVPGRFYNSVGVSFIRIDGGEFTMGSTKPDSLPSAIPARRVRISEPFYIATQEVTVDQWRHVMGELPPSNDGNCGLCAVDRVSWYEVNDFIEALNRLDPRAVYRLPTEAEWEFAYGLASSAVQGMAGNVREWCFDWYKIFASTSELIHDPRGPPNGSRKVFKGAVADSASIFREPWFRGSTSPSTRGNGLGFRLVAEKPSAATSSN